MQHLSYETVIKVSILLIFILSMFYIHLRGKVRLSILQQLANHSTFMAPINCLLYLFSGVPNKPYLSLDEFKELQPLQDNWQVIRDEALQLFNDGHIKGATRNDDIGFNSFFKRGWRRFYLKWYNYNHPSAKKLCANTVKLINDIPSVKAAMFALLPPDGKLNKHRDPYAGSLRYHLGLITPNSDECSIFVDGIQYSWRDGEAVMFDETFIHHAYNRTDQYRLIFFCDIERPINNKIIRWINRMFGKYLMSAASSPNLGEDKTGLVNHIYRHIHTFKMLMKVLKDKNRTLFKITQYALIIGILYLVFLAW